MALVPSFGGLDAYVVSGDSKGEVKAWNASNGDFLHGCEHGGIQVMDITCFQDATAGKNIRA